MDLFSNLPPIEHAHENSPSNEAIYKAHKARLTLNSWVLLFCMLEGQKVNTLTASYSFTGMSKPRNMAETRKRIAELKEFGIDIMFETLDNGIREHRIPVFSIAETKAKYDSFREEILIKLNKPDGKENKRII